VGEAVNPGRSTETTDLSDTLKTTDGSDWTSLRQTYSTRSDKTVIRRAIDVHAKLGKQYKCRWDRGVPRPRPGDQVTSVPPDPRNSVVVVSQRPTIITFAPSRALALSNQPIEIIRRRADAIAGNDEVARSSALECWAYTPCHEINLNSMSTASVPATPTPRPLPALPTGC